MEELIKKLLIRNGYIKLDAAESNPQDAYINTETKDCMIISEYSLKDLVNFQNSDTTRKIMDIFNRVESQTDFYKDTSLIILYRLNNYDEYETLKNIFLDVEENPYAFRKYIVTYTNEGVNVLLQQIDIVSYSAAALTDADAFKDFEKGRGKEYYRLILELYVKLPFLQVRGVPELVLDEFDNPSKKKSNLAIMRVVDSINDSLSNENEFDFDPDPDLRIAKILQLKEVGEFIGEDIQ